MQNGVDVFNNLRMDINTKSALEESLINWP